MIEQKLIDALIQIGKMGRASKNSLEAIISKCDNDERDEIEEGLAWLIEAASNVGLDVS